MLRRYFLTMTAVAALVPGQTVPTSGVEVPELAVFDRIMTDLITKYQLPGGSLAVVNNGRLVLARGYGYADREANQVVQPFHLFRMASLSKPVTAMTIMKLVQDGKLRLDAKLTELLPDLQPPPGVTMDSRYRNVTVQQLLHHSFGSDSGAPGGDPAFRYTDAQRAFPGAPHNVTNMVRFGIGLPLQFDPGTRFAYSNLGYHLLGRIIEKVTGKGYEAYVREEILAPMGITAMRIGRPTLAQRFTDEVKYYDFDGAPARASLLPGQSGNAPRPYGGGFLVDVCESYGGWIGSSVDLVKFVTGLDGRRGTPALLTPATMRTMFARPPYDRSSSSVYYSSGWQTRPTDTRFTYFHSGSLPGTRTYLVSFFNGRAYAAMFNMRPRESEAAVQEGVSDAFVAQLDRELGSAFGQVQRYPDRDLFPLFAQETLNTSAEALSFTAQAGGDAPAAQTLNVTSSGAAIYSTLAPAANTPWLRLDRTGGFTPTAYRVTVNPAGLEPGEYTAALNVVSGDARNSPRTVRVTLRVFAPISARNGASLEPGPLAPGSLLVLAGSGFADGVTARLGETPLALVERSPERLLFVVPEDSATGPAVLTVKTGDAELTASVVIEAVAPGLFSANRTGQGVALATAVEEGSEEAVPVYECASPAECAPRPIAASGVLRLLATGVRKAELSMLAAKIGDVDAEVMSVAAGENPGEDLVTLKIPADLAGRGDVDVVLVGGERRSNAVRVNFR
jgi:N-acyl-D-amino-acid deacylase